jgi:4-amino-4-deoxy-L-arabinose transferase-like glycosyltransferase
VSATTPARAQGETQARANDGTPARPARLGGGRVVWWSAAAAGVVVLGLLLWQLLIPRPFYTGTNSVGVRSVVANLNVGQKLCVPDLQLPADTGRVQLAVFAHRPQFTATLSVIAAGRTVSSRMTGVPGPGSLVYANAPIPTTPAAPTSVPATVCIAPRDGPIELGGMIGLQANQLPARLDGAPWGNRIGVWFLPPAGVQRSVIESAGAIFTRAALFRPGIVGSWTYPFLLLCLLPLCWALSLLALARAAAHRPLRLLGRPMRLGAAVFLVAFLNAASWALITPAFDAPDEPSHFSYAQYFAETGHAPSHNPNGKPEYSTDEAMGMNAVNVYSQVALPDGRPPWSLATERAWEHEQAVVPHPADNGGGATVAASPHQPAYYALLAPAYLAVGSQSTFSQLTAMRLMSALLGAIVALCAFGVVREVLPRHPAAAVAAGLLVAFQPMFGFISGAVNNDNGVNALAAISLYLTIRALRRGLTWRTGLALALALAFTPLMKETGYEIYPAVAVGLLGILWRSLAPAGRRGEPLATARDWALTNWRNWAAIAAGLVAVRVVWSALQPVFYPPVAGQPAGSGGIVASGALTLAEQMPGRFLVYLWELFLPRLGFMGPLFPPGWPFRQIYVERGWGAFGWYTWEFPNWVYTAIVLAMAIVALLALSTALRERRALLKRVFEVAVIALFPIGVLVAVEAAFFAPDGGRTVVAEQGRYIFPAIAALAAIAVAGTFGLGRRLHLPLVTVLVVAMIGLSYAAQWLTLSSAFT